MGSVELILADAPTVGPTRADAKMIHRSISCGSALILSSDVPANRGGHGVPSDVVIAEVTAAGLTHVISDPRWSGTPQRPASLFLTLFQK